MSNVNPLLVDLGMYGCVLNGVDVPQGSQHPSPKNNCHIRKPSLDRSTTHYRPGRGRRGAGAGRGLPELRPTGTTARTTHTTLNRGPKHVRSDGAPFAHIVLIKGRSITHVFSKCSQPRPTSEKEIVPDTCGFILDRQINQFWKNNESGFKDMICIPDPGH